MEQGQFFDFLRRTDDIVKKWFSASAAVDLFRPAHIREGVLSYIMRPAKRLRPAVMLLSCGCLGGEERMAAAVPAAAGLELFHTWTLVHDDIIDNDDLRRGRPTVHVDLRDRGIADLGLSRAAAEEYGRSIAILSGDVQHGWVINAFDQCRRGHGVEAGVVLTLLNRLETHVVSNLIYGEVLDVQFSLLDLERAIGIGEEKVIEMIWLKTGVLYEFSATAGAMIGLGTEDFEEPRVRALANFASNCGIAFQLQDDILGVVGNAQELGKPIGSDIREGKKTTIVLEALRNADEGARKRILSVLGHRDASLEQIREVINLLGDLGGVDYTRALARSYIERAIPCLEAIHASPHKDLLYAWADFMVNRNL